MASFEPSVAGALNAASGLALLLLGAWIAAAAPRRLPVLAFGLSTAAFGARSILVNVAFMVRDAPVLADGLRHAGGALLAGSSLGLVAFALAYPTPLARGQRLLAIPAALPFVYAVANPIVWSSIVTTLDGLLVATMFASLWSAGLLLALRFRREPDASRRREIALVASALLIFPAVGAAAGATPDSVVYTARLIEVGLSLLVVAVWMLNLGVDARPARAVAWTVCGSLLAGSLMGAGFLLTGRPEWAAAVGVARLAGAAVVGYGILRHQMLGIDAKARFALRQSTLATVFVAVYFTASEASQEFLGDRLGSAYVGIAASATLLVASAPLRRAAARLASRAVPVTSPEEETYRVTVGKYLASGGISREEERHLARLATRLGIDAERAVALREEVELATIPARS